MGSDIEAESSGLIGDIYNLLAELHSQNQFIGNGIVSFFLKIEVFSICIAPELLLNSTILVVFWSYHVSIIFGFTRKIMGGRRRREKTPSMANWSLALPLLDFNSQPTCRRRRQENKASSAEQQSTTSVLSWFVLYIIFGCKTLKGWGIYILETIQCHITRKARSVTMCSQKTSISVWMFPTF